MGKLTRQQQRRIMSEHKKDSERAAKLREKQGNPPSFVPKSDWKLRALIKVINDGGGK